MEISKEDLLKLYSHTISDILSNMETFQSFLYVASQHYKQHSANQIYIFAQAPNALLVGSKKVWENLGGTIKHSLQSPRIFVLVRNASELILQEQYSENNVYISQDKLTPFLSHMTKNEVISILGENTNKYYQSIWKICDNAYDLVFDDAIPLSRETCIELSTLMLMCKLGLKQQVPSPRSSYEEMIKMDVSLPKAMQWINQLVREVYSQFEKGRNENGNNGEEQIRDLWQDVLNVSRGKRSGSSQRSAGGGQLTFEDLLSGEHGSERGAPKQNNADAATERDNSILAGGHNAIGRPLSADRQPSAGTGNAAFARDVAAAGTGHQGLAAPILHEARERIATTGENYGGSKTKYKNNIAAIETLKVLEQNSQSATVEDVSVLKRYTGWGGIPEVFDERREDWKQEREALLALLSPDEYKQARRTTLNAHYTPSFIVREMWNALHAMGVNSGNLLDPSAGNGRFYSERPFAWDGKEYAVELDSISGRITQKIHPQTDVHIKGYQEALFPDGFFDAIISNVPFGNYSVNDTRYNKNKWAIHEYYFGKSLDLVKPGGVIAFITSKYLMDKKNNSIRKYIAQRAELVGAVRLPANTFKGIANTEVTADILILRKREKEIVPDDSNWLHLGYTDTKVPVNEYFLANPENVLGEMRFCKNMYGNENDTACVSIETAPPLKDLLHNALQRVAKSFSVTTTILFDALARGKKAAAVRAEKPEAEKPLLEIPADPSVKNYTYTVVNGHLYYRDNAALVYQEIGGIRLERIAGMVAIKDALMAVIHCQTKQMSEEELSTAQATLTELYDAYIDKYGYLNNSQNDNAFKEDVDRPLLQSLEVSGENDIYSKADIFSKRTIFPFKAPVVNSAQDALIASINRRGSVNLEYMQSIYPKSEQEIVTELGDRLFVNPVTEKYETAEEYLSGNVKKKLLAASRKAEVDPKYKRNELALEKVQPKPLSAAEISFSISSTWIPEDIKHEFLYALLGVPYYAKKDIYFEKESGTTRYVLNGKPLGRSVCFAKAAEVYGTRRHCAFTIFEDCLNLQISSVYDTVQDGDKKRRVLNGVETQLSRSKQASMEAEFVAWISNNKERARTIEDIYNDNFNIYVPRTYDGSYLEFPGMADSIQLRAHQKNAAARILLGGNTLLAHEVGAGKTYTMAAGGMLKKQAGLSNKAVYVIPSHMLDQWTREFYSIYPSANLLMTTARDFEKKNRQRFISRIATGDYDAIIMTFTQFERIPMSPDFKKKMIEQELAEIETALAENMNDKTFSVKRLEKQKASLEAKLEQFASEGEKDDVLYFEQLGIDQLFIDEAHYYKNCYVHTKISNVAGLGTSRAEKSFDLLMKLAYLDEKTDSTGTVFATGTPITNSLSEMFVMQRYLQRRTLEYSNIAHFDQWASAYATIESILEIAPEGTGFRDRSRFTSFNNLPELVNMFHLVADVQLIEEFPDIDRPRIIGGKPEVITVPASEYVQKYIAELARRAEAVRSGNVDPQEDNMLLITSNGRNVAIDPRLIDENAPVNEDSKIYAVCRNILRIYSQFDKEKALQLAFQDVGIQLYPVMEEYLVQNGIPDKEIAFIHDANTDKKKADLFEKCRNGDVRVLFGSTAKMGTGTNIQNRLIALHHIDCPWRPSDLEQRDGRILRQGNMFEEVYIFQYITQGTFDSYLFQTVELKQRFISQIMTNKSPARSCADLDETVLNYAEIKALAAGDVRIREKMELDNEIGKMQLERQAYQSSQERLGHMIETIPSKISHLEERLLAVEKDIVDVIKPEEFSIVINDQLFTKRTDAGEELTQAIRVVPHNGEKVAVGKYAGMELLVSKSDFNTSFSMKGNAEYPMEIGLSDIGNITRIENMPDRLPDEQTAIKTQLAVLGENLKNANVECGKAFPHESKLKTLLEKKAALDFELEMELSNNAPEAVADEYEPE